MNKSKLAAHLDAVLLSLLLVVLFAAQYWTLAGLESVIGVLLAFVMPGWLFVRLLFGERPFELEVEILLILFVSAFLMAFEALALIYFRVSVDKSLFQILAAGTDVVLLVILKVRQTMLVSDKRTPQRVNWPSLLAAVCVPFALFGFGLFHIHETRESFTEFFVVMDTAIGDAVPLMVESHEERNQFFTLVCLSQADERVILGNFELSPGETQRIDISYRQGVARNERLRLMLDQHKGEEGYRWVEIPGERCEDLSAEFD